MSEKRRSSGRKGNGRWRGGNNNNNNNKKSSKNKSTGSNNRNATQKVEFAPYSSNQKGAYAVYDTVLKAVISKVSAECNKCTEDIVESLEDDKYIDLDNKRPKKKLSTFYSDGWSVQDDGYVIDGLGAPVTDFEDNPVTTDSYFYKREKAHANRNREAVEEDDEYIHRERLKTWIQRVDSFETNKRKAYDIILKFCSGEMKERLDNHPNKDSFRGDPIATLKAIRMVIHDPIKARYEYASLTDALFRLMTIKQHENENLSVFTKRYRAAAELVESHLGKDLLSQFVKRTDDYKQASDTEKLLVEAGALEQWFAYHYTTRVDQSKYGGWCRHQELNQGNVGTNEVRSTYPKTIQAAYDALRLYKWDKTPKKDDNKPKTPKTEEKEKPSEETKVEASFSTQEGKFKKKCKDNNLCFICGDQHPFNNCNLADKIARIHWYVNSGRRHQTGTNHQHLHHQMEGVPDDYSIPSQVTSQLVPSQHTMFQGYHYPTIAQLPPAPASQYAYQQQARSTTPSVASLPPNQPPPWNSKTGRPFIGCHLISYDQLAADVVQQAPELVAKALGISLDTLLERIMIDSGSTVDLVRRNAFKGKVRKSCRPIGIDSSNGHSDHDQEMSIEGWSDRAYISDTTPANIFGLCNLIKKFDVKFDSTTDCCFHLYDKKTGKHLCKVSQDERGLWTKPIPDELKERELVQYLETMSENAVGFTPKQVEDAKRARSLYHNMNCPSISVFKKILQFGGIKNCPVTVQDAVIAERIFGPDVPSIKGRATRRKESRVRNDLIVIPPEFYANNELTLCIDMMYINGMAFLASIDTTIRYRSAVYIKTTHLVGKM